MLEAIALILIILAILVFLLVHFGVVRPLITTNMGLALFAAAVMLWLAFGVGPVVDVANGK